MGLYLAIGLAILLAITGIVVGVDRWETRIEQRGYDRANSEHAAASLIENAKQREIEAERARLKQEAIDEAKRNEELALAAADRERVARERVQIAFDNYKRGRAPSNDPAVTAERAATDTVGDVFGECRERYAAMGSEAQRARTAGQLCERLYDSNVTTIRSKLETMKGKP